MYSPSDIIRPEEFPQDALTNPDHLYHCLGKFEYEIIAQRLLDASQQRGEWVSLPFGDFVPPFREFKEASRRLQQMASESRLLTKEKGIFRLTERAIEVLVENHPSGTEAN